MVLEDIVGERYGSGFLKDRIIWTDEQNARSCVTQIFNNAFNYSKLSRKERCNVIKDKLKKYAGNTKKFLIDELGLSGLIAAEKPFLERTNSTHAFFKWFDPELFDLKRKHNIPEWELIPRNFWNDEEKARTAVSYILKKEFGYSKKLTPQKRVKLIHKKIINSEEGHHKLFTRIGLSYLLTQRYDHNYVRGSSSVYDILTWFDPEVFDLKRPHHIHEWEFVPKNYFNDEKPVRKAVTHLMMEQFGYSSRLSQKNRVQLIRSKVINSGVGPSEFLTGKGFKSFMSKRGGFIKYTASALALLKWYAPDLFDHTKKHHLHEWEFSSLGYWDDPQNALRALDHILKEQIGYDKHLPFRDKARIIDGHLIGTRGGINQLFCTDMGLAGLIGRRRNYLDNRMGASALLRFYFNDDSQILNYFQNKQKDNQKVINGLLNGVQFEKRLSSLDILSYFFRTQCIYRDSGRTITYKGSEWRYPNAVFRDAYEKRDENGRVVYRDTIIDVKRGMNRISRSRYNYKGRVYYSKGDIKRYSGMCDNLIFVVGEYYSKSIHDKVINKLKEEFSRYAKEGKTLSFIFADEIIKGLNDNGYPKQAKQFETLVGYAQKMSVIKKD